MEGQFNRLLEQAAEQMGSQDHMAQFQSITNEIAALKEQRGQIEEQQKSSAAAVQKMTTTISLMEKMSPELTEWDESWIRQLVDTVKVLSEDTIMVYLQLYQSDIIIRLNCTYNTSTVAQGDACIWWIRKRLAHRSRKCGRPKG